MRDILKLIDAYQSAVGVGVESMKNQFNTSSLLSAWRSGIIPKNGVLASGIEYDFHGVGCLLIIDGLGVDFDFGPDDRYDGFDLWRLGCFIDERPELYKIYFENNLFLKEDFQNLIEKQIIIHPNWFPGSTLCYFYNSVIK